MFDLSQSIARVAISAIPLLLGVICHEVAHGYVALLNGDPTAKNAGRLTFNPAKHLDSTGTLVFIVSALFSPIVIGWAKPVPINPVLFRNIRRGVLFTSMAGALANFTVAILFFILFRFLVNLPPAQEGSIWIFFHVPAVTIAAAGVFVNAILGVFNLLPIPPLDGSKILAALLPGRWAAQFMRLERFGFIILILIIASGALDIIFQPVLRILQSLLISIP